MSTIYDMCGKRSTCAHFVQRASWHGEHWIECGTCGEKPFDNMTVCFGDAETRDALYMRCCVGGESCEQRKKIEQAIHDMSLGGCSMSKGMEMAKQEAGRLSEIEWQIHDHMERAASELLDVGRCLVAAKDGKLVPDGHWSEWVLANTGMSVRSAQRLMQAAREVAPDSALAKLSMGKITALLALPAAEREEFAAQHDAGSATVRELQLAVASERKARKAAESNTRLLNAKIEHMRSETSSQIAEARAEAVREYDNRINTEIERRLERSGEMLERMQQAKADADEQIAALHERIAQLEAGQQSIDGDEISHLNDELERQSRLRSEAQAEVLRLRKQLAQGGSTASSCGLSADDLRTAVNAYLGRVGALPHMGVELASADMRTREAYRASVDMIAAWCAAARTALDAVAAEAVIV